MHMLQNKRFKPHCFTISTANLMSLMIPQNTYKDKKH